MIYHVRSGGFVLLSEYIVILCFFPSLAPHCAMMQKVDDVDPNWSVSGPVAFLAKSTKLTYGQLLFVIKIGARNIAVSYEAKLDPIGEVKVPG